MTLIRLRTTRCWKCEYVHLWFFDSRMNPIYEYSKVQSRQCSCWWHQDMLPCEQADHPVWWDDWHWRHIEHDEYVDWPGRWWKRHLRWSCSNEKVGHLRSCIVEYGMEIAWPALDDWDRLDNARNLQYTRRMIRNSSRSHASTIGT